MAELTVPPVALSANGALPEAEPVVQRQPGNDAQQVGENQPADKGVELTAWQLLNFWEAVSHCAEPTDYDAITAMLQKAVEEENQANAAPVPEESRSSEAPAAEAVPDIKVADEFMLEFMCDKYQIAWTAEGTPERHPAWPSEFVLVVNNDNTDEPYFQVFRNKLESLIIDTTKPEPRSQAWPERKTDPDRLVYQLGRKYVFGPASLDEDGAPITGLYWQESCFDFAEHAILGDRLNLKFSESETVRAGNRKLVLENGMKLTYGEINGFGGDFFATNNPICTGADFAQQCQYFKDAYSMLARGIIAMQEARALRRLNQKERDAIVNAISTGRSTKQVYKELASSDSDPSSVRFLPLTGNDERLIAATLSRDGPNYLRMALLNLDHFGDDAHIAYNAGHTCALQAAAAGNLELGYAMNAFADHYLGDCFASGHIRTPRRKLHAPASSIDKVCSSIYALYEEALRAERGQTETYNLPLGVKATGRMPRLSTKLIFQTRDIAAMAPDACSKFMHDEDNKRGLVVYNKRGDQWTAFGDTMLFEAANEQNLRFMTQALQASADEVYRAYATRSVTVDSSRFAAWDIAPLGVVEQHCHRPLFTKEGYYRANIDDPYCSQYHDPSSYTPVSLSRLWEWPKGYARLMLALSNSDYFKNL